MKTRTISIPRLGLISVTRAILGAGIGLLAAERLARKPRRRMGWALVGVGALSTVPLVAGFVRQQMPDKLKAVA